MSTTDALCDRATLLGRQAAYSGQSPADAAGELVTLTAGDRAALEAARDRVAVRLGANQADFEATAALTLLNRALAAYGWDDRLDWRRRWAQHRKP